MIARTRRYMIALALASLQLCLLPLCAHAFSSSVNINPSSFFTHQESASGARLVNGSKASSLYDAVRGLKGTSWVRAFMGADGVSQWIDGSLMSSEYRESALVMSDVKVGSRLQSDRVRTEEELRLYFRKALPAATEPQINRLAKRFARVDRQIAAWRNMIRDLNVPNEIAIAFARAADDERVSQLFQEVALGYALPEEIPSMLEHFETVTDQWIVEDKQ
jgi:hypothetical protein